MPFRKGQSGNPSGRPKALADWRRSDEAARLRDLAYDVLEQCVKSKKAMWKDRVTAASILLDRTEGKACQPITGPDDGPIRLHTVNLLETLQALATDPAGRS